MTIVFRCRGKVVAEVLMIWRPEKGDLITVGGTGYVVKDISFMYDVDIAKWSVLLEIV